MRLLSLTLRNYRVHQHCSITFDSSRNLIGGPNETGKSTIAEAIHRSLFLRSKTGGNLRAEMRSSLHGGDPETELAFDACNGRWTLEKRFAGTKGSARLADSSGNVYKDDEAETKLAELLKCETQGGRVSASQLASLWSHLWIWQGSSGADPSGHTSEHKDSLVQRLQQEGLAAVMQSPTDQRVREKIAAAWDDIFTSGGKPKTSSKLSAALSRLTEAESALGRAKAAAARLEQDAATFHRTEQEIAETEKLLPSLRLQKSAAEAKLTAVEKLRMQEETDRQQWETAASLLKEFAAQDAAIRKLQEQAVAARAALTPADQKEALLIEDEKHAAALSIAAEASQRESSDAVRLIRLQQDLAAATLSAFEKAAVHQQFQDRSRQAGDILAEISNLKAVLTKLPPLTPKDLESLRKLERKASEAGASLSAMATGLEVLATGGSLTLDGYSLNAGDIRTLTDSAELAVGPDTRIRIRPGGGTSLSEARLLHETAVRNLTRSLDQHTLRDLDEATKILQQRENLDHQISLLETRCNALGGNSLASGLAAAAAAHEAARTEVQRRLAALDPAPALPENPDSAREWHATLQQSVDRAGEAETNAQNHTTQLRQRLATAAAALQNHRVQTAQARQGLRDLETRLLVLEETHGDTPARETTLAKMLPAEQQAAAKVAVTRQQLADLAPQLIAADLDRFTRAIAQQEERRREAESLHAVARDRLILDGTTDPHAELALAVSRHQAALESHLSEERHAHAIDRLHQLFSSSREAIDRSIIQPLADRISGYLQCLFGSAAQVRVNLSDSGIDGFELIRAGDPAFSFDSLSGGTKEQVAAAVRLGMAEILAAGHDGCLPILFDDAFAYTDPDRVQSLQRMLDLAATRGLQVIVLTCTPADYTALGAMEVRLNGRAGH